MSKLEAAAEEFGWKPCGCDVFAPGADFVEWYDCNKHRSPEAAFKAGALWLLEEIEQISIKEKGFLSESDMSLNLT